MPKQKFEVEVDVPDGYEIVDHRPVRTDETFLSLGMKAKVWEYSRQSGDRAFILRKVPVYRDPVLPADWGKPAHFSDDGKEWVEGRLACYAAHYADDKNRWGASGKHFWYKFCQVLDE